MIKESLKYSIEPENVDSLIERLKQIDKISNEKWLESLNLRKQKELEFHDRDRDRKLISNLDSDTYEKFYSNKKYYSTTSKSQFYVKNWIKNNAKGKVFLDYACGNGANAIYAAKSGAALSIGIDISSVSINNAKEDARKEGAINNTYFVQADAENTLLPDQSIDVIICSGMLHHLDLSYAFPELRRILAPGGKILAVEALDYNPFIKLYRQLTPNMRTEWEKAHILSFKDIKFAGYFFEIGEIKFWHIFSYLGAIIKPLLPLFNQMDNILTKIPFIQLMAWIFTFELKYKDQSMHMSK